MEDVGAWYLENVVQVAHGFDVFDHGNHQYLGVNPGRCLVPGDTDPIVLRPTASHAPVAVGKVAGGPGDCSGLLARVDVRHDYPLEAAIEEPENGLIGVVGDAGNRRDAERFGGANHVLHLIQAGRSVFAVNHHEVIAESAENLNHVGSVAGDDCSENDLAGVEFGLGGVGTH